MPLVKCGTVVSGRYRLTRGFDFVLAEPKCTDEEIRFKNGATFGCTAVASSTKIELTSNNTTTTAKNHLELDCGVSGAVTGSERGIYVHLGNESTSAITGELTAGEFKVRSSSSNTSSVKGLHVCIDAKANTITLGRGIEVSIDAGENVHGSFGTVQALRVAANWSGTITTSATGLQIDGPATWTYGIDMNGGTCTTDIRFSNGALLTNSNPGDMELTIDNTSTSGRNAWQVDYRVSGICTGSSRAGYFACNNTSGTAITGELTGIEAKVRSSSSDTTSVKGMHVCIDAKANTITTGRGIEISIDAGENVHGSFGVAQGLRVAANWSGTITTRADAIAIEGPATWTHGIYFAGVTTYPLAFLTAGGEQGFTAVVNKALKGNVDGYITIRDIANTADLYILCYDTFPS